MKLNLTKKVAEVTLFAGALLAASLFAGGANVQSLVEDASHTPGNSKLLVGTRGNQRVVYTFHVVELDENFIYDPLLAQRHGVIEAKATENIPVLVAKKQ
jgi:hypothetical protein